MEKNNRKRLDRCTRGNVDETHKETWPPERRNERETAKRDNGGAARISLASVMKRKRRRGENELKQAMKTLEVDNNLEEQLSDQLMRDNNLEEQLSDQLM